MTFLFELIFAVPILAMSLFLSIELVVGVIFYRSFEKKTSKNLENARELSCAILIPAHNEEHAIGATLSHLNKVKTVNDVVVVVADNCNDKTSDICHDYGAQVVERLHTTKKGKGYALQRGKDWICENLTVDIVIIFDADCVFSGNSLEILKKIAFENDQVTQACYLMRSKNGVVKTIVPQFTWWIKNAVRATGLKKLASSAHIQGSGIAFPNHIFEKLNFATGSIVEDLELGIKLSLTGQSVFFTDKAQIESFFPVNQKGLDEQRTRWEHGHLATIAKIPKQLMKCVIRLDIKSFFLLLDAAIPPLISFLLLQMIFCAMGVLLYVGLKAELLFLTSLLSFSLTIIALFIVWLVQGRNQIKFRELFLILQFLVSKLDVYKKFVTGRKANWDKTTRDKN